MLRAHRLRLQRREAKRRVRGGFAAERTFIDLRRRDLEGDAEARDELLAVAGGGREHEPPGLSHHFVLTEEFER